MSRLSVCIWSKHFDKPPSAEKRFKVFEQQVREIRDAELVVSWMEDMPFREHFTAWALNASIRKAKGDFIICTNRDIIFNHPLIAWLSNTEFRKDTIYRIDRTDVPSLEPYPDSIPVAREYARHAREEITHGRQNGLSLSALTFPYPVPHSNGCGDFLLMHRDHWFRLRGFPELRGPAFHIDSFVLYNAIFSGVKQEILKPPLKMYHVDHPRPDVKPIPALIPILRRMLLNHKPIILNSENWGMF